MSNNVPKPKLKFLDYLHRTAVVGIILYSALIAANLGMSFYHHRRRRIDIEATYPPDELEEMIQRKKARQEKEFRKRLNMEAERARKQRDGSP